MAGEADSTLARSLKARPVPGAQLSFDGNVVSKLHQGGTDPRALRRRVAAAARSECLLSPVDLEPEPVGDRWLTRWPRLEMVPLEPGRLPWAVAGELLARLHTEPLGELNLAHGASARLTRAVARLGHDPTAEIVRRAAAGIPPTSSSGRPITLVHGDFHLGQLGRSGARWLLIDVDDLGVGDPAWDLARPAGFWAAGLIPDADWHRFLDCYRGAGGPAVPSSGDPWPALESVARTAVVTAAANHPEDTLLVAACARMG